jgi:DnaK suppressor protein
MTPAQLKRFREKLLALSRELEGKVTAIEPNRTDEARIGGDEDEQPLNEMLQSIASSRNKAAGATLVKVKKALQKLDEAPDDFGLCEGCDEDILPGRLEAMPYVEYCVECQSKHDGPRGGPTRKKLTDYR